jgi:hypothetical protein
MASDIQRGTRKMDAGDWIRLKRLKGGQNYLTDMIGTTTDITNPPPSIVPKDGRRVFTEFGTSKIRRPASSYTDYVASRSADYIMESYTANGGKQLIGTRLCDCNITFDPVKHNGVCAKCGR